MSRSSEASGSRRADGPLRGGQRTRGTLRPGSPDPLVSIVTVSYNSAATIEKTIDSVLGQTYGNIEYIIVDGGSTDGTVEILRRYEERLDYWVSEPDEGIYFAMNKGIRLSTGVLMGIINSDDWYEPDAVELAVEAHKRSADAVVHGLIRRYVNGEPTSIVGYYSRCLESHMIPHPAVFVPRVLYDRNGLFDTSYRIAADYELMVRNYACGAAFLQLERVMANFRSGGASERRSVESRLERLHIRRRYGLVTQSDYRRRLLGIRRREAVKGIKRALAGIVPWSRRRRGGRRVDG